MSTAQLASLPSNEGPVKISKVHQIVRLRQMLQKWRRRAAMVDHKAWASLGSALSPRRRRSASRHGGGTGADQCSQDSDDAEDEAVAERSKSSTDVPPQGFLAVYVGAERRRFVIRTQHLNHPLFRGLLEKTEEELGFSQSGGLAIACEPILFEHLLWMVEDNHLDIQSASELSELLDFYHIRPQEHHHHHHQQTSVPPSSSILLSQS